MYDIRDRCHYFFIIKKKAMTIVCLIIFASLPVVPGIPCLSFAAPVPTSLTWADHSNIPPTGPISRHYEPLAIGCENLVPLLGLPFKNLRLNAYSDGRWQQISFQIDDRLSDNRLVFPHGPQANPQDGNALLDEKDELIFMVRDAGQRQDRQAWPEFVDKGVEIKIVDPVSGAEAFVYLFYIPQSPPPLDQIHLIVNDDSGPRYTGGSHLWQVEGIRNEYKGKAYKTIANQSVTIPGLAGGSGINFVDTMKVRFEVRFLFGMLKLKVNEKSLIGEVSRYRGGPLRLSVRSWSQIKLPGNLKSPKLQGEMYLFETFIAIPIVIRLPFNPGMVITDFRMSIGYDLNPHALGMKFYNSNNLKGFRVDGIATADEKRMNTAIDEWRCVTGRQGSILTYSDWDQEYRDQARIEVFFIDDSSKNIPPETHPGQMGYFHNISTIKSLKPRDYTLVIYVCFPPHFYDPAGLRTDLVTEYLNIRKNPVYAVINNKINKNRVAYPEPMWPTFD